MLNSTEYPPEQAPGEQAAWAALLHMTPRKRHFVRTIEGLLRLILPLLPSPLEADHSGAHPSRILVIEYWNMGDLAIVLPFLKNLRQSFPGARISLVVKDGLASFLEGQGLVDEFIPIRVPWAQHFNRLKKYNPFSKNWISLFLTLLQLRKRQFDWAFSGRMDVRDNLLLWLSGARRRIGYGVGGGGFLLTDRVVPDLSRPHRADVWLQLLNAVGGTQVSEQITFHLSEGEIADTQKFLSSRGIPFGSFLIGIHPGARIATRRWGNDRFAEVAQHLQQQTDAHFLWFSDPGDPSPAPKFERCHSVSLGFRPFLAVLSRCHLLVCNDSGPMHFANLLGVPVVAVFGSTNPVWFGPRGAHDRVVIRPEFWCRPCFDYCIFDQPYCLRTISPDEVLAAVLSALRQQEVTIRSGSIGGIGIF
jgi:ADP-heptose:LPS heptosyltransferase